MNTRSIEGALTAGRLEEAERIQRLLHERVEITPLRNSPRTIAGTDAAYLDDRVIGTVCVFTFPGLEPLEEAYAVREGVFPYVPGFLSFREGPAVCDAVRRLSVLPEIVIFDGHGLSHPRGFGIASHIGVLLDLPSIGCAKTRLIGEYREPGILEGSAEPMFYEGKTTGAVLRTRNSAKPVFVSPGHRIDLRNALDIVLASTKGYRLPEPLRAADSLSRKIKKQLREI